MDCMLHELKDNIAVLTLNRPGKMNAFNRQMALELQALLDDAASDKAVRAVYLTGAGRAFCSGQDLSGVNKDMAADTHAILAEQYHPVISRIREIKKPVICAVNGVAAGAGANIALCCDVVVAAASASFIQAFSKIGLIPDSGGTFMLPRLVGWQKASAYMMLGEAIPAAEAERCGMIYKVFPDEAFAAASFQIAATLASLPTLALAYTKEALHLSAGNTLEAQLQTEDRLQAAAVATHDFREGIAAFLQKRPPVFTGE